jgi:hypothetical protein
LTFGSIAIYAKTPAGSKTAASVMRMQLLIFIKGDAYFSDYARSLIPGRQLSQSKNDGHRTPIITDMLEESPEG